MKSRFASLTVGAFALMVAASLYAENVYTYQADILPVLEINTCTTCHAFTRTYDALLSQITEFTPKGVRVVYPGRPDSSMIVWRLQGSLPSGEDIIRMPRFMDPLPDETIQMVIDWIAQGAPDDIPVGVESQTWGEIKTEYR